MRGLSPGRGAGPGSGEDAAVGAELARLASSDSADGRERARQVRGLVGALAASARRAGASAVLRGRWLVDTLLDAAPRLSVRDLEALRAHHPGLEGEALAAELVRSAARSTALVGAAGGAVASATWSMPPSMVVSAPVEVAAEALAVAAIEVKLVAELHAVYGAVPAGSAAQRAQAYVMAWADGRGVDPTDPRWMAVTLGSAARAQIRRRLMGRAVRGVATLGPLLSGAVAGAVVNNRSTWALAERIEDDLRRAQRRRRR